MKIKRLVLEVAMPEDVNVEIAIQGLLKSIRKHVGKEKTFCDLSFDLIAPQKIMWLQNEHELKGDLPPQMLMQMAGGMPMDGKEKLPIGFPDALETAAKKQDDEEED